jgi:hypothetical protein
VTDGQSNAASRIDGSRYARGIRSLRLGKSLLTAPLGAGAYAICTVARNSGGRRMWVACSKA